jgi:thymidylate kinase
MLSDQQLAVAASDATEPDHSRTEFLYNLFAVLDAEDIRYCVLHSWEKLPERLTSDLDIAVHPDDAVKLPWLIGSLKSQGYIPVQLFNYQVNAHYFVFSWRSGIVVNSIAVDIIFEHRRGGLIIPSGRELVSGRRRNGLFWIPAPDTEFTYLLAKKVIKGTVSPQQARRLQWLVNDLGFARAKKLVERLFPRKYQATVVEACATARLDDLFATLKNQTWKTSAARNPIRLAKYLAADGVRRLRRWLQPTGLFVVVLGPDGSGKSTVINHVVGVTGPMFRRHKFFHWRPALLWGRKHDGDTTQPHSRPVHSSLWSTARLFGHLLDYWLGYCISIRPSLARSSLVVFDRYFQDVIADPKRYRFGGPGWLVRLLGRLVPKPDLCIILDAPVDVIFSRKREVAAQELQSQKVEYLRIANHDRRSRVIDAAAPLPQVVAAVAEAVQQHLAERFEKRHAKWLQSSVRASDSRSAGRG